MKSSIIKLNFLIFGLIGVVFIIYKLNSDGLPDPMQKGLGLESSPARKAKVLVGREFSWCHTRVAKISTPDGYTLYQEGSSWLEKTDTLREVDFIAVEKWFGKYCKIRVTDVNPAEKPETLALIVDFIKGPPQKFYRQGDIFAWRGQNIFRSPELATAIGALAKLPTAKKPGQ